MIGTHLSKALREAGMITDGDLRLFRYAENAEQAWVDLVEQGLRVAHAADAGRTLREIPRE